MRRSRERHGITLAIRIGINTGEVVTGRGDGRLVAGDAVNVAARLEQAADPGTVLAGERTFAVTRRLFHFEDAVALDVKGKSSPVRAHRLRGTRLEPEVPASTRARRWSGAGASWRVSSSYSTSRCRRERRASRSCSARRGSVRAGSSRNSSLVHARRSRSSRCTRGRCLAAGRGITFWALAGVAKAKRLASRSTCRPIAPARQCSQGPAPCCAPLGLADDGLEQTAYALATSAGFALPANPLDQLEPRIVADELARAWPRFATALASQRPTILVIEDLHWAGDPLVALLDRLLVRSRGRLLVVATARPGDRRHPSRLRNRARGRDVDHAPGSDGDRGRRAG